MRRKREKVELTGDEEQIVSFVLGRETFAILVSQVREIGKVEHITKVPKMPAFIEGVMNLRGQITTVIDLKKRLNVASEEGRTSKSRIIVAEVGDHQIGMVVDSVDDVMRIPRRSISPPPKTLFSSCSENYLVGVCRLPNKLIMLLDLTRMMECDTGLLEEAKAPTARPAPQGA